MARGSWHHPAPCLREGGATTARHRRPCRRLPARRPVPGPAAPGAVTAHTAPERPDPRCGGSGGRPGWGDDRAPDDCLARNEWICGAYLSSRSEILQDAVVQHLRLTTASVALGLLLALPLTVAAHCRRWAAGPVLGVTTVLYTIPSLALFSLLLPPPLSRPRGAVRTFRRLTRPTGCHSRSGVARFRPGSWTRPVRGC